MYRPEHNPQSRVAARGSGGPVDPRPRKSNWCKGQGASTGLLSVSDFQGSSSTRGSSPLASNSDFIPACHGVYFNPDVAFTHDCATYGGFSFESHTRAITGSW